MNNNSMTENSLADDGYCYLNKVQPEQPEK